MKNVFRNIDTDELNQEDLILIKKQLKEIEKKVKENNKPKTITISNNTHNKIKKHCQLFGLNIGDWTEQIILREVESKNCIIENKDLSSSELSDQEVEDIKEKYIKEYVKPITLIKVNKPLMSSELKFKGWSIVDGYTVYEYTGKDFVHFSIKNNLQSLGVTAKKVLMSEVTTSFRESDTNPIILEFNATTLPKESNIFDIFKSV